MVFNQERVTLNFGGVKRQILRATLTKFPGTVLSDMFAEGQSPKADENQEYYFDRDGAFLDVLLNYYRIGKLVPPPSVNQDLLKAEMQFFGILPTEAEPAKIAETPKDVGQREQPKEADEEEQKQDEEEEFESESESWSESSEVAEEQTPHEATPDFQLLEKAVVLALSESRGDVRAAGELLRQLLEQDRRNAQILYFSAYSALRRGDNSRAKLLVGQLLQTDPTNVTYKALNILIDDSIANRGTMGLLFTGGVLAAGYLWWSRSRT